MKSQVGVPGVLDCGRGWVYTSLPFLRQDSPSRRACYHQWDHFRIHPKLLIRGSWIFKYLPPLICLTISILSLGLFCVFFLLHICSVIHASSSDVTGFQTILAIPSPGQGWVLAVPRLPVSPCSFCSQRRVGGGTACRVLLWKLISGILKFILIIIIYYMCLSLQILQRYFISSCFTVWLSENAKCWHSFLNEAMSLFLLNI